MDTYRVDEQTGEVTAESKIRNYGGVANDLDRLRWLGMERDQVI